MVLIVAHLAEAYEIIIHLIKGGVNNLKNEMAESRDDYPSPDTARSEGTKGDLVVADVSTVAEFIGVKPKLEKPGLKKEELYSYQCSNDTPIQMQGELCINDLYM